MPFKSPSLAQHFEAPENYRGIYGWICGYSADADFLNDAAERFTRQTKSQRAYEGVIALAMMLDPGNPQIVEAPGVRHLPIKAIDKKPFTLLHAKVAILGFRHESEPGLWHLRLIVSTGNWTRETLEKSLDLAWRIDITSEDIEGNVTDKLKLHCADIKAAWNLLKWLSGFFNLSVLNPNYPGKLNSELCNAKNTIQTWIDKVSLIGNEVKSRFIDNREESLCKQLPKKIRQVATPVRRNYLGMGSGFYESSTEDKVPLVLKGIVDSLRNDNLLTVKPEIDIFVNPLACQAVANSLKALSAAGFTVRPAGQPSDLFGNHTLKRSLHAKFIFSANCRENSNYCNSPWLYLGSGNLTGPGFTNQISPAGGNLEAGVVFAAENLYWEKKRNISPDEWICNILPLQWESDVASLSSPLTAGAEMPEREIQFVSPPVAWMIWYPNNEMSYLKAPDGEQVVFDVLNSNEQICEPDSNGNFLWKSGKPRHVTLRWQMNGKPQLAAVPVLDEFGRLAATDLPQVDLDEVWWLLANFPVPPEDEELTPSDYQLIPSDIISTDLSDFAHSGSFLTSKANYPIRTMMKLIENIAAKQTAVMKDDWVTWCTRLEQSLMQVKKNSTILNFFMELGVNPLSPLREAPFRPCFAEDDTTDEGKRYESVLERVESEWNFTSLSNIGGIN